MQTQKKSISICCLMSMIAASLFAQTEPAQRPKFVSLFQVNYLPGIGTANKEYDIPNKGQTFSIRYVGAKSVGNHLLLGLGLGYDVVTPNMDRILDQYKFVPILLSVRYCLDRPVQGFSVFADPGAGLTFSNSLSQGFSLQSGGSYRHPLQGKLALQGNIGYSYQHIGGGLPLEINAILIGAGLTF